MTPHEFIQKWQAASLSERSAYQQHFLDLCELLGQPKPAAADPEGAWYTFERGVLRTEGGNGWADVWMRGHFGWEYKGKHKNLDALRLSRSGRSQIFTTSGLHGSTWPTKARCRRVRAARAGTPR